MGVIFIYTVYAHTTPSGKKYIGITKQTLPNRWQKGNGYKRCPAFAAAINKYGWDNIQHETIDTCETLEEANALEKHYVDMLKTADKRYGYNCTSGGDGVSGWTPTEDQRRKNSEAKKEMWENNAEARRMLTEERRRRGSTQQERDRLKTMSVENWNNPEIAVVLKAHLAKISRDKEIRKKSSAKMKAIWKESPDRFMRNRVYKHGESNKRSKPVICTDTGKRYCNARFAERETGVDYRAISACATGRRKSANGTHWEFATL